MTAFRFLSCDWGTTSFRLRLVDREAVVGVVERPEGVRDIHSRLVAEGRSADPAARQEAFASILASALAELAGRVHGGLAGEPLIVSGMASASVGWRELPYAPMPTPVDGSGLHVECLPALEAPTGSHPVWLVSGLCTGSDMMRGEECELCGLLAAPDMDRFPSDSVVILPGTHSKHVRVREGTIVESRTHLTGELLELLCTRSLLGASVEWPPPPIPDNPAALETLWGQDFDAGVRRVREAGLAASLFGVRARAVLGQHSRASNSAYLSGLLVGGELTDLAAWAPAPTPILLAASARFALPYRRTLETLGVGSRLFTVAPEAMAVAVVRTHARLLQRVLPAFATGTRNPGPASA
jgi:2-dehydro-3-deoxygalactonokinase